METKLVLVILLALAFLAIWLLPYTRLARGLRYSERSYLVIHWVGVVSSIIGIAVTIAEPVVVLEEHWYELLLFPVFIAYAVYPAIVSRVRKNDELLDEKQIWDTTRAAAFGFAATLITMFLVYAFYREEAIVGLVWFPLLIFNALAWYSGATIFLHREE